MHRIATSNKVSHDAGWVQFEGPLAGDSRPERGPWLGVAWDPPSQRGTRSDGVWQGKLLFTAASPHVSFLRRQSVPPESVTGLSFVEAVALRYGARPAETEGVHFDPKAALLGRAHIADGQLHVPARGALWAESTPTITMVGVQTGKQWMQPAQILNLTTVTLANGLLSRIHTTNPLPAAQDLWDLVQQGRRFDRLAELDLSGCGLLCDWTFLQQLQALAPRLRSLNLSSCRGLVHPFTRNLKEDTGTRIDEEKVQSEVQAASTESPITHVQFCNLWTDPQYKTVSLLCHALRKFPNAQGLSLSGNSIEDHDLALIRQSLPDTLQSFDLSRNQLVSLSNLFANLPQAIQSLDMSENKIAWTTEAEHPALAVTYLNADRTNLQSWKDVFCLSQRVPNLVSLRVWQNPLFEHEQEDQECLRRNRYIRWSLFGHLTHCDGEVITAAMRKEAELYVISLARRWKDNIDLFGPEDSFERVAAVTVVQRLCLRQEVSFESLHFGVDRLQRDDAEVWMSKLWTQIAENRPPGATAPAPPVWRNLSDAVMESIYQMPPMVKLMIDVPGQSPVTVSIFPTYTTVESLKLALGRRFGRIEMVSNVMVWHLFEEDQAAAGCKDCEARHTSKQRVTEFVLEPDYHRLSYFGIEDPHDKPYRLTLRQQDRTEFSTAANYQRSLDAAVGHGVLKRLR